MQVLKEKHAEIDGQRKINYDHEKFVNRFKQEVEPEKVKLNYQKTFLVKDNQKDLSADANSIRTDPAADQENSVNQSRFKQSSQSKAMSKSVS